MGGIFDRIFTESAEMFDIAARCAEAEAEEEDSREQVLDGFVGLAKSCKGLMLEAKKRAQEERAA